MAIKVTKRGEIPEEKGFHVTCAHCKSEMDLTRGDVTRTWIDPRERGEYAEVKCPVCGRMFTCVL